MKDVYEVASISKQALHQHRKRSLQKATEAYKFFERADKIRKDHPGVGCRTMAKELCIQGWGRDKIEDLLLDNGYRLHYRRSYVRTTYSQTDIYHPNLIEGLELTAVNQVVQTDITYFKVKDRFCYIIFLIDVYSRRIVGYAASKNMQAEANIRALKMLLKNRSGHNMETLIHHSDRGRQYVDKEYRRILDENGIRPSMCKAAWENAYTERVNRTIKEEYLSRWQINEYETLVKDLNRAVKHYNTCRKHKSLGDRIPIEFETEIQSFPEDLRPKVNIYKKPEVVNQKETDIY